MRIKILACLSERDKRSIRCCCRKLKSEIDSRVGLSVTFSFFKPIRNFDMLDWLTNNVLINEIMLESEQLKTSEMMVLLQSISAKTVRIRRPEHIELIPLLTTVSSLEDLRHLSLVYHPDRYLGFLPISRYRFCQLRVLDISISHCPKLDSFASAHILRHVQCPQLKKLKLSFFFESSRFNNSYQRECLLYSQWLLDMIETFPSIRSLDVELLLNRFMPNPEMPDQYLAEWAAISANAEHCARRLKNVDKLGLHISDNAKGRYAGMDTWIHFAHSVPNVKSLTVNLWKSTWSDSSVSNLFQKNGFPHLQSLTLFGFHGTLDFKMLLSVSNKINTLEFNSATVGMIVSKNLDGAHLLGLIKLTCDQEMFDTAQLIHITMELQSRPQFHFYYSSCLNIETAEKLGNALTLSNFEWNKIIVQRGQPEQLVRAVELCRKFGIDTKRVTFVA